MSFAVHYRHQNRGLGRRSGIEGLGDGQGVADDGAFIAVGGNDHTDLTAQISGGRRIIPVGADVKPGAVDLDLPLIIQSSGVHILHGAVYQNHADRFSGIGGGGELHPAGQDTGLGSQRHAVVTCAVDSVPIKGFVGGYAVDGHGAAILNNITATTGGLHTNVYDVGLSGLKCVTGSHFGPGIIHGAAVVPGDLIHGVGTVAHRERCSIGCLTAHGVGDLDGGRVDELREAHLHVRALQDADRLHPV